LLNAVAKLAALTKGTTKVSLTKEVVPRTVLTVSWAESRIGLTSSSNILARPLIWRARRMRRKPMTNDSKAKTIIAISRTKVRVVAIFYLQRIISYFQPFGNEKPHPRADSPLYQVQGADGEEREAQSLRPQLTNRETDDRRYPKENQFPHSPPPKEVEKNGVDAG
jgi:hypothetical protein